MNLKTGKKLRWGVQLLPRETLKNTRQVPGGPLDQYGIVIDAFNVIDVGPFVQIIPLLLRMEKWRVLIMNIAKVVGSVPMSALKRQMP